MGGERKFKPGTDGLEGEQLASRRKENDRLEAQARAEGEKLLLDNPWAREVVDLFLDARCFGRNGPVYNTPWLQAAFRCLRQGSGGLLGAPPLI